LDGCAFLYGHTRCRDITHDSCCSFDHHGFVATHVAFEHAFDGDSLGLEVGLDAAAFPDREVVVL
jgi:hypothetical protein